MRKLLPLFALLLLLPLLAAAQSSAALDVDILIPIACNAQEESALLPLYCGPTQGFYRHGEQALDTAKPYVVFGQYDCWTMTAQGTAEAFGPVGWVETALLPALPAMPELPFADGLSAMVEEDAAVTNDPLGLCADTWAVSLTRGEEIMILAQYGDWLYVQTEIDSAPARVFLPAAAVL